MVLRQRLADLSTRSTRYSFGSHASFLPSLGSGLLHLKLHDAPMAEWLIGGFLGVALTLAIAAASWKSEKPLLRRGHRHNM